MPGKPPATKIKVKDVLRGLSEAIQKSARGKRFKTTSKRIRAAVAVLGLEEAHSFIDEYCLPGEFVPPPRKPKSNGGGKRK